MKDAGSIYFGSEKWMVIGCDIMLSSHLSTTEGCSDFHPLRTELGKSGLWSVRVVRMQKKLWSVLHKVG